MTRAAACILAILGLMLAGCCQYPLVPLEVSSYGYEMGDIVLIDTKRTPEIGDLVLYDANVNRSHCMAFGPGVYIAKVIGRPGDNVSFSQCSYEANGCIGSFECGPDIWPRTKPTMWGTGRYEDIANMELTVPEGEYLADKWVGLECPPGEYDEHGSAITYNRFTIKREAIQGIILKKIWHSKVLEEDYKSRVY